MGAVVGMVVVMIVGNAHSVHFLVGQMMVVLMGMSADSMLMIEMHKNAPLLFSLLFIIDRFYGPVKTFISRKISPHRACEALPLRV